MDVLDISPRKIKKMFVSHLVRVGEAVPEGFSHVRMDSFKLKHSRTLCYPNFEDYRNNSAVYYKSNYSCNFFRIEFLLHVKEITVIPEKISYFLVDALSGKVKVELNGLDHFNRIHAHLVRNVIPPLYDRYFPAIKFSSKFDV